MVPDEDVAGWHDGNNAIYSYGNLIYDDVFSRTCTIAFRLALSKLDRGQVEFYRAGNGMTCTKDN